MVTLFLTLCLTVTAKNGKPSYPDNKISTRYADSLAMKDISIGDVFIVDARYIVYAFAEDPETNSYKAVKADTLQAGTRFKIVDTVREGRLLRAVVVLPDSSKAFATNLPLINKYC